MPPRSRIRRPDIDSRLLHMAEAGLGLPAVTGLGRVGTVAPSGGRVVAAQDTGQQAGQVRVDHLTLSATADQTIANGGADVEWAVLEPAPVARRGFATLTSLPVTDIPIAVTGVAYVSLRLEWESYRAGGAVTVTVTRDGDTQVLTLPSGPITSRVFDEPEVGIEVRAGDTITVAAPNSSGSGVTLTSGRVEVAVWELSETTSIVPTGTPPGGMDFRYDASTLDTGTLDAWPNTADEPLTGWDLTSPFGSPGGEVVAAGLNDLNVVDLTGTNCRMDTSNTPATFGATSHSVYLGVRRNKAFGTEITDGYTLWEVKNTGFGTIGVSEEEMRWRGVDHGWTGTDWHLYELHSDASGWEIIRDGTVVASSGAAHFPWNGDGSQPFVAFFNDSDSGSVTNFIRVCEAIGYGTIHDESQRRDVRDYFADRWDIGPNA